MSVDIQEIWQRVNRLIDPPLDEDEREDLHDQHFFILKIISQGKLADSDVGEFVAGIVENIQAARGIDNGLGSEARQGKPVRRPRKDKDVETSALSSEYEMSEDEAEAANCYRKLMLEQIDRRTIVKQFRSTMREVYDLPPNAFLNEEQASGILDFPLMVLFSAEELRTQGWLPAPTTIKVKRIASEHSYCYEISFGDEPPLIVKRNPSNLLVMEYVGLTPPGTRSLSGLNALGPTSELSPESRADTRIDLFGPKQGLARYIRGAAFGFRGTITGDALETAWSIAREFRIDFYSALNYLLQGRQIDPIEHPMYYSAHTIKLLYENGHVERDAVATVTVTLPAWALRSSGKNLLLGAQNLVFPGKTTTGPLPTADLELYLFDRDVMQKAGGHMTWKQRAKAWSDFKKAEGEAALAESARLEAMSQWKHSDGSILTSTGHQYRSKAMRKIGEQAMKQAKPMPESRFQTHQIRGKKAVIEKILPTRPR